VNPGTRLGSYEVLGPLGKGGMGEVYRARDTRVDRVVALKILPQEFFESEERRVRFEREARMLASLNHPGIAVLYSFEEIPSSSSSSSRHLLVMELVEGETLSARLAKGPLPLERTLHYGAEIARALDAAHRKGIVHRDLKPANVMLTKTGVKLLDFGLARAIAADPADGVPSGLTTQDRPLTVDGGVVGTLPYMAPEQVEGRPVDARTDIFALGATLYEMAAGRRPFHGANAASLAASILASEPAPITSVRPEVRPALERVVRTCLAKDPDDRWQSAADVARGLQWVAAETVASAASRGVRPRGRERLAWGVAALAVLVGALSLLGRRPQGSAELTRFKILAPPGESLLSFAVLSPDARSILLLLRDAGGTNRLAVRTLDNLEIRFLPGTENARGVFWSPDSKEIAFFADGRLKRMSAEGGPAQAICDSGGAVWGAWSPEGTILFSRDFYGRLSAIPAAGGEPRQATAPDAEDVNQNQPAFLPDGRHFVYLSGNADFSKKSIRLGSLGTTETKALFRSDSSAAYASPGYLLFGRDDAVFAWRFDPKTLHLEGEAVPALSNVHWSSSDDFLSLSAAANRLAYVSWELKRQLVWVDRKGREAGTLGDIGGYGDVRISPDGRKVAVCIRDLAHSRNDDVWVLDAARGTGVRLTSDPADEFNPAWFPDGERVAYVSDTLGAYDLFERPAGGGPSKLLVRSEMDKISPVILRDGRRVLLSVSSSGRYAREIFDLGSAERPVLLGMDQAFSQEHATISPDGLWSAWDSVESGQREVYLQPVPDGPKRQVSVGGGQMPVFARNGREIFYVSRDGTLMSVFARLERARVELGEPLPLFPLRYDLSGELPWGRQPYDVSPDGQRFLVIRRAQGVEPDGVVVISNWDRALRAR